MENPWIQDTGRGQKKNPQKTRIISNMDQTKKTKKNQGERRWVKDKEIMPLTRHPPCFLYFLFAHSCDR